MYFILSKYRKQDRQHDQLCIVVADSIDEAAKQVGLSIQMRGSRPDGVNTYASLEQNFVLDIMPEWNGKLPEDGQYERERLTLAQPPRKMRSVSLPS